MDRRLYDAAITGNLESLLKLIEDDPRVLRSVALAGGETPLHIACLAGHLHFVQELVKLSHGFARELNQDGFSPLHIASACGDRGIVEELVKVDPDLCILKGIERRIPLHCAAIKGRIEVMEQLLWAHVHSIEEVTARGETALHLAVKSNQFEALRVLVEHLKQFNKEYVMNNKDGQGNTILHLAVSRKQYEVVDLMLNVHIAMGMVEGSPLIKRGLTPLDVLLLFQSEAGDREIEENLRAAGAQRAEDPHSLSQIASNQNQHHATSNSSDEQSRTGQRQSRSKRLLEFFKYNEIKDSPSEVRNTLLVIAILIATATYQAVLNPPGGVWQDDSSGPNSSNAINTSAARHTAGEAVMGSKNWVTFGCFLLFNSIGFFTSLRMINFLTLGFPFKLELRVSILALVATYCTCMPAISSSGLVSVLFIVLAIAFPLSLPVATNLVRNHWRSLQGTLPCTSQASG